MGPMYIRMVTKSNLNPDKRYVEYRLVKSYRLGEKVLQKIIMTMPDIRLPREQWRALARALEALIMGQEVVFESATIQEEAQRWYDSYRTKQSRLSLPFVSKPKDDDDYELVSCSSLTNHTPRSIGKEHIALSMYRELGFERAFTNLGFNFKQRNDAALSILGRMLEPKSEHGTLYWARNLTGLGALLGTNFSRLSQNSLYRITDLIYKHKDYLENMLQDNERSIFNLRESIILYDLTNTYLEGRAKAMPKAKFGRSKEKRSDCRLLTLGLVIDDQGFPKRSKVMEGSVSEPGTLSQMISYLSTDEDDPPVVVFDAGIATEANLSYLRERNLHYICVARNKPVPRELIGTVDSIDVNNKGNNKISVQLFKQDNEHILYCESEKMGDKEQAMQELLCGRFEAGLGQINESLHSKHGKKKYDFVLERVHRLKGHYSSISGFYTINLTREGDLATNLSYLCTKEEALEDKFSGSYFLRTSIMSLDAQKLWSMYMMLNTVESAFRTLKSELNFRPVFHQKENRAEAHLFIAVLAYHVVNAIRYRLKEHDIHLSWDSIRTIMRSHQLLLTTQMTKSGILISTVNCSSAEENHKLLYNALGISSVPVRKRITKSKVV